MKEYAKQLHDLMYKPIDQSYDKVVIEWNHPARITGLIALTWRPSNKDMHKHFFEEVAPPAIYQRRFARAKIKERERKGGRGSDAHVFKYYRGMEHNIQRDHDETQFKGHLVVGVGPHVSTQTDGNVRILEDLYEAKKGFRPGTQEWHEGLSYDEVLVEKYRDKTEPDRPDASKYAFSTKRLIGEQQFREQLVVGKQYIENMEHNNEYIDYPDYSQLQYRCQEACTVYVSARPEEKQQIFDKPVHLFTGDQVLISNEHHYDFIGLNEEFKNMNDFNYQVGTFVETVALHEPVAFVGRKSTEYDDSGGPKSTDHGFTFSEKHIVEFPNPIKGEEPIRKAFPAPLVSQSPNTYLHWHLMAHPPGGEPTTAFTVPFRGGPSRNRLPRERRRESLKYVQDMFNSVDIEKALEIKDMYGHSALEIMVRESNEHETPQVVDAINMGLNQRPKPMENQMPFNDMLRTAYGGGPNGLVELPHQDVLVKLLEMEPVLQTINELGPVASTEWMAFGFENIKRRFGGMSFGDFPAARYQDADGGSPDSDSDNEGAAAAVGGAAQGFWGALGYKAENPVVVFTNAKRRAPLTGWSWLSDEPDEPVLWSACKHYDYVNLKWNPHLEMHFRAEHDPSPTIFKEFAKQFPGAIVPRAQAKAIMAQHAALMQHPIALMKGKVIVATQNADGQDMIVNTATSILQPHWYEFSWHSVRNAPQNPGLATFVIDNLFAKSQQEIDFDEGKLDDLLGDEDFKFLLKLENEKSNYHLKK